MPTRFKLAAPIRLAFGTAACALMAACGSSDAKGSQSGDAVTSAGGTTARGGSGGTQAAEGAGRGGTESPGEATLDAGVVVEPPAAGDDDAGSQDTGLIGGGTGGGGSEAAGAGGTPASEAAGGPAGAGGAEAAGAEAAGAEAAGAEAAAGTGGVEAPAPGSACRSDVAPSIPPLAVQTIIRSNNLSTLTFATQPPNSDDWYLTEQKGRVLIVRDGTLLDTPFLDLSGEIDLGLGFDQTTVTYDERGLSSIAFAPDYAESGLFYVAISPSAADSLASPGLRQNHDLVLEYKRSADPDRADPTVVRTLHDDPSSSSFLGNIHNINTVRFGPDGALYFGVGDGGGVACGDAERGASQDIARPFGKIARLDLRSPAPYGAADNPFSDVPGAETVLHYGVRNPFRFNFDRETGDLYFGDVGQTTYEEQNFASAGSKGLNFGWPALEGESPCPGTTVSLRAGSTPTPPIFIANRTASGPFSDYRASVGGVVYRGSALPELVGTYVFGDYYGARLGALQHCGDQTSPTTGILKNCDPNFPEPCLQSDGGPRFDELTAIVEDHNGEIYVVASGNSLLKVVPGQ